MNRGVAVVGSANLDIVAYASHAPRAGETVLGTHLVITEGGKGANQAIAAAAFAKTAFIGCVGDDDAGRRLLSELRCGGVMTGRIVTGTRPTGHALITVSEDGENRIVVVPGANEELSDMQVTGALDALQPAVILSQLEISMDAVLAAARWARRHEATFLFNPSPMATLSSELVSLVDVLVVNVGEASAVFEQQLGVAPPAEAGATDLAKALCSDDLTVVVTAGARGAALAQPGHAAVHVPAETVQVVDTTGAGDAFAGSLAGLLAGGLDIESCVRQASSQAAQVVALPRDARSA